MELGTSESSLLKGVMDTYRAYGFPAWRVNSGALRDSTGRPLFFILGPDGKPFRGFADTVAVVPRSGRWLAGEVKVGRRKPTPEQTVFLALIRNLGGLSLVIRDLAVLARALDALKRDPWLAHLTEDGVPLE